MDIETLFNMNREENRQKSFKNWPFDDETSGCTSRNMAQAGFFHCPTDQEPDLVRCFVCHKELDCWEPTDNPMKEHKKHEPQCPFIKLGKTEDEMTISDFIKLEGQRQQAAIMKYAEKKIKEFDDMAAVVMNEMDKLA